MKSITKGRYFIIQAVVLICLLSFILNFKFLSTEMILKPDMELRRGANDTNSSSTNNTSSSNTGSSSATASSNGTGAASSNSSSGNSNNSSSNSSSSASSNTFLPVKTIPNNDKPKLVQVNDIYNSNFDCTNGTSFNTEKGICDKEGKSSGSNFSLMSGINKGTAIEYVDKYQGYKTPTITQQIGPDWKFYDRKKSQTVEAK